VTAVAVREAVFAALTGFAKSPLFFIGFGNNGRHRRRPAVFIERNKGQIGRAGVPPVTSEEILGDDFDADFHRCVECPVHRGSQDDQFSAVDRVKELKAVDGNRDYGKSRMANGGHGSGQIDQMHDFAAENISQKVNVVGKREFGIFGVRFADGLSLDHRICGVPGAPARAERE